MQRNDHAVFLFLISFGLLVFPAFAQERNLLPKYGSLPRTKEQKEIDAQFIAAIDQEYHGDRKKAANDLAMHGWQYLAQQNAADAMRRFNQAWLLNGKSGAAIWGMAATESSAGKFDESLLLFTEAEKLVGDNLNFSIDYAKALGMAGVTLNDENLLKFAFRRFEVNYKRAPQNAMNLQNWAITLFGAGQYSESWAKVKIAEALPDKAALDPRFLEALYARMPRPRD